MCGAEGSRRGCIVATNLCDRQPVVREGKGEMKHCDGQNFRGTDEDKGILGTLAVCCAVQCFLQPFARKGLLKSTLL